jgi:hypothetical protein
MVELLLLLRLVGDARMVGPTLRLTGAERNLAGAAWLPEKRPIAAGFHTQFQFQLTGQGGLAKGADGFAFVLQNAGPDAVAGRGSSGGWAVGNGYGDRSAPGIPLSLAIFFDTFKNDEIKDPSDNFLTVSSNGKIGEMQWPPSRLAHVKKLKVRLKDGRAHEARIDYVPPVLSVDLDGARVLSTAVDARFVTDADGASWVGFTASTGSGYENHDILSWTFESVTTAMVSSDISYQVVPCLADRNLCTPERATVEATGPGKWHVVVPAHLEWPASVPATDVEVTNARGMVCWDLAGSGAEGCGGVGALTSRVRDGRTWFEVKDPTGRYADNEGHLEFDVQSK